MAARNYAQVAPTAATMALNAYIYGYGGHSLVTPHAALKTLWWTDERIEAKVTRAFVVSKLRGEERDFLDKPLAFGEGLTDDSYMEWILDRAKRLFLILAECGVPDQIFGCIDDSWDDEDLPLALDNVRNLELSYEDDEALDKKFYDTQFLYLLRELKTGTHIDYEPKEHIPMEHVNTVPPAVYLQPYDRVHFPNKPDDVFMRRKFPLTDRDTGHRRRKSFLRDMKKARAITHHHVAPIHATYTTGDAGFLLSGFVPEHTLNTFIEHRTPTQYLRVPVSERPALLLEWMHCLADALAFLHHRGIAHTHIRPSQIWIDKHNKIALADIGTIETLQRNKKYPKTESYDYAAPEQPSSVSCITIKPSSPPVSSLNAFSRIRKMGSIAISDSSSSTSGTSGSNSTRSNSIVSTPITPSFAESRTNSFTTSRTTDRYITCPSPILPTSPQSPTSSSSITSSPQLFLNSPTTIHPDSLRDLPTTHPSMSDIYSLGCVFLDILTFAVRGKNSDFIKFRTSRVTTTTTSPSSASILSTATNTTTKRSSRPDSSFHANQDRIAAWLTTLDHDAHRLPAPLARAVPPLLPLVRAMLAQNASLRPTAAHVRDRVLEILTVEAGLRDLCCEGREWTDGLDVGAPDPDADDGGDEGHEIVRDAHVRHTARGRGRWSFRKTRAGSRGGDGGGAGDDEDDAAHTSEARGLGAYGALGEKWRDGSVAEEEGEEAERYGAADGSALDGATATTMEAGRRRSASASVATARLGSWRSRFRRR